MWPLKGPLSSRVVAAVMAVIVTAAPPLANGQEANGIRHRVEIQQFRFVPEAIEVKPGDTIVWVNLDIVPHTVTATDASWDSGNLDPDAEWEMTVGEPNSGGYFCAYHPAMTASIDVGGQIEPIAHR